MGGGFARSDWPEVLEEDENSGQFSKFMNPLYKG